MDLAEIRRRIRGLHRASEELVLQDLMQRWGLDPELRARARRRAQGYVTYLRDETQPSLMEAFLAEYGLSTEEGVALMCLAEALLRVPDTDTIDELIEDKIVPSSWGEHLGQSSSSLVNASTWGLLLTGTVLDESIGQGIAKTLHGVIKRIGEPIVRAAVHRAMKELGRQFVLGQTMPEALKRASVQVASGYTYSFDMLGEAAMTAHDADVFFASYRDAISELSRVAVHDSVRKNPGISIKLSALHPRYEATQNTRVMQELIPRVKSLALSARDAGIGFNIDAEEANRLDLSLDVVEAVLSDPDLAGWDGFGVVIQAYSKRASAVVDWLYSLAVSLDRRIMVRLVKGAYWDTEIKHAQVDGVADYPVFTRKAATDVAYLCCARQLLSMTDRIYPQFATHNANTVAAILEFDPPRDSYEFQRLHGMGEALHQHLLDQECVACRIYAPVGSHRELLAYLVRRLLENGANSSFVNQIVNKEVPVEAIALDPFDDLQRVAGAQEKSLRRPPDLFGTGRMNSRGWSLDDRLDQESFEAARKSFKSAMWKARSLLAKPTEQGVSVEIRNPADPMDLVGTAMELPHNQVESGVGSAETWDAGPMERAEVLRRVANLYEENHGEIFAILCREAGKTPSDAIGELREAVDFLRYYANQATVLEAADPRGTIVCISPWNFPLAIFTGQIAAALAAGNAVIAKPAEATPIIAWLATRLMHKAGVPKASLQLVLGEGGRIGAALTRDPRIHGVCFTGSTNTAQRINISMAESVSPDAPLIAETGGVNAMIVDSTALPEQAVRDILTSAFQSAGQRCSALRILYLQEDISDAFKQMLFGAMDELKVGDPWNCSTDIGPVIDAAARAKIDAYIAAAQRDERLLKQIDVPAGRGEYVRPSVIAVHGISAIKEEVFGPVLHLATFRSSEIDQITSDINASGYGLTFGLHSRIDKRIEDITSRLRVGNIYVNRNQIGAIVESQPFGGEGLSGTGPKAGGPNYVSRFTNPTFMSRDPVSGRRVDFNEAQAVIDGLPVTERPCLDTVDMPGPTGESNRLSIFPRGVILCLGPSVEDAELQALQAAEVGCQPIKVAPGAVGEFAIDGVLERSALASLRGIDGVALWSREVDLRRVRRMLAGRQGPILPLITEADIRGRCQLERHLCIDTTAAGGNTSLLAQTS